MKYDYSMSDGDFYRTYGMSQEQAAASESSMDSWGATEYVVLAGTAALLWYAFTYKKPKKYKFKSLYKEAPVAAAFKYA